MNAIPAAILLLIHHRHPAIISHPLWYFLAGVSLLSAMSLFVTPFASTGFDRLAIYLTPIQAYVWSRIPEYLSARLSKQILTITVIAIYAGFLFIWLNFSDHAGCWVPYVNILF